MATTEHFYTGNGSTTSFAFTFPYLSNDAVKVELDNVLKTENSSGQTNNDYTISNTNIVFNSAPGNGVNVHIYRNTNVDSAQATFAAGSSIRAADLNNNQTQVLYSTQEAQSQQIRTTDIKDGAVTSLKIQDGTIVDGDVNASAAIAGTKVSPNFGSQNIQTSGTAATGALGVTGNITVSGTVDGRDLATDGTKLDGIEASATADQTAAEIRTLVENASDSNVFTDADHTKLNGIEASATADQTASEIKTLIASSPLDSSHLAADSVGSSEIAANAVGTSEIADAELVTLAGMQSGTASKLADSTALTADLADLNQIDGMAKETTITDDDTKFPTSGAVVDYVAAQIAPLGGLEVIATEVAFPNAQPASGVVISISDAGGVVFNGSGSSTTGRTVGGSTVTINNAPSSLNGETLVAGVGLMVSSTGSSQIYNYHKILGKEDDIKQLSDDINDFNARYRVNAGEPGSNNDAGDLLFDTNASKMKVYDGSSWGEVTSTGEFKYLFLCPAGGSGAPTFNGSIATYDLREVSNSGASASVTTAAQLIVSVNGVIQKANTGTSAPSEGFAMVDANTIVFGTNLPSGSDVFIVQVGSAVSIPTPGDDTCSTAKIQNGAITQAKVSSEAINEAKLQVSNAPTNGYFLSAQSGNSGGMTWAAVDLTALSASNLTSGTIPNARFPATLPAVDGSNLTGLQAGATGGNSGANACFWENEQTITHNYTISNNKNAGTFGPITINSGVTVTVGAGENWTIV
jgi:hypothetical protein